MEYSLKFSSDWIALIEKITSIRKRLKCSKSYAWFRGQTDSNWHLSPSLYRFGINQDPDDKNDIRKKEHEIESIKINWNLALNEKKKLKKVLQNLNHEGKNETDSTQKTRKEFHDSVKKVDELQKDLLNLKSKLKQFKAPLGGEREIYEEYIFRAAKSGFNSSWQILGEMRHYGIPTRLLDWTDRLDIALYFALEKYRKELSFSDSIDDYFNNIKNLSKPCIWVFNPYTFSKKVTGRSSIWDIVQQKKLDYYERILINRDWDFDEPIPIYPPSYFERIKAQNGYFLSFGNLNVPLDVQIGNKNNYLEKVEISSEAALYGIEYLRNIQGLNNYSVFRDLDSLGSELSVKFRGYQNWRV